MAVRSKSSAAWLNEHVHDHYVHLAKKEGFRARAAYKLLEINERDKIIRPGMHIADLGSSPGSWSQAAVKLLKGQGSIIALDILPMAPVDGVRFVQGDFREPPVLEAFEALLDGKPLDLVICDMAPNITGNSVTDDARSYYLAELALDFSQTHLRPGGSFLVKVFQGAGLQDYQAALKTVFSRVSVRKPKASRSRSGEVYLLAQMKR